MTGHLIETAIVAAVAVVVSYTLSWVLTHRASDEYARHSIRRAVNFLVFLVALNSLLGGSTGSATASRSPASTAT